MTTYRAELTSGDYMWITYGQTMQEARLRMRQLVGKWVVTTGNPWPMGEVEIVEIDEQDTTQ